MTDSPQAGVRPARPHTALTEDGRRIREVLSYSRRGSRLSDAQQAAWDRCHEAWWIPDDAADGAGLDLPARFGREAPLVVEIGCGIGEATSALAAARPDHDVLGFEVWHPGVAETFQRLERAGVTNVRMISVDAVWSLQHLFAPGSVAELWTFFPDPWPKKRHHARRLVDTEFAALAASRLAVGGLWRLATDWPAYAEQMVEVLDAEPTLVGGVTDRWADRPVTRFERRGVRAGRPIVDLTYRRT
ncbi:MAG: tRNA (guanosine(46)-N7)-methyltransferase TrmB [Oryzihumus sp.]